MQIKIIKRNWRALCCSLLFIVMFLVGGCERDAANAGQLDLVPLETVAENAQYRGWLNDLPAYSREYDPSRDPAADLQAATLAASESNKLIFVVVGGDWCSWCHVMTRFFSEEIAVQKVLLNNYEFLKLNVSEDNSNEEFLAAYPEVDGYPHIYILSSSGDLLHSQNAFELQHGNTYSAEKFARFLQRFPSDK